MASKSELMTYIGVAPGNECNFLFMHSTNAVFTTAHAVFDEHHFSHCPKNRHEPLRNPLGGVIPTPSINQPGNIPDDIDSNNDVEHDHGYPHSRAQDDNPKCKEPQAPEDEPKEQYPPRTPSPNVPPPALRTPLPVRSPPPSALQHPGQAECHQNMSCPPMINLLQCPQHDHRVPCTPETYMVSTDTLLSNSGTLKVPPNGDKQLLRPLGPNKRTHQTISPVISLTPLQRPLRKMCKRCARKGE